MENNYGKVTIIPLNEDGTSFTDVYGWPSMQPVDKDGKPVGFLRRGDPRSGFFPDDTRDIRNYKPKVPTFY